MTIAELLAQRAAERGGKPFIICEDAEYTYGEMNECACRVATNLAARGVGHGDKVILLLSNCVEFLYVFLGLGRIGAVCVPINPTLKPEEITYIANHADAETFVTTPAFAPLLPEVRKALPRLRHVFMVGDAEEGTEPFDTLLLPVENVPEIAAKPEDDMALIYTSGTTGLPKGVVLTHKNYMANMRMIRHAIDINEDDRFFCVLPLFHVNGQVVTILTPLLLGCDVLLMKRFDPFRILPMIEKYRATVLSAVPTIYNLLTRLSKANNYDVSSIRFFITGAAPIDKEIYDRTLATFGRTILNGYGLSEATCGTAVADSRDPVKWDSVGAPLRYGRVRILDETGKDVPNGEVGEIHLAGPNVMKGYYKNPEATAAVLKDGWLKTGDLGRFDDDGYLYIVGRCKEMIIHGGQNVYPQEIERCLWKIEGVEECCVVGIPEKRWGQAVLAVIKQAEGYKLDAREVIDFCRQRLARYKCPSYVRFVDELPKTATGKIRKNVVAEQFAHVASK